MGAVSVSTTGELPPPTCGDGVSSSVEVMVATGDLIIEVSLSLIHI